MTSQSSEALQSVDLNEILLCDCVFHKSVVLEACHTMNSIHSQLNALLILILIFWAFISYAVYMILEFCI